MNVNLAASVDDALGEGPVWIQSENTLRWTDILGKRWHVLDLATGNHVTHHLSEGLTAFAPIEGSSAFIGAFVSGIARLSSTGEILNWLAKPEEHIQTNRFNDGGSDPSGRFLAGTMNESDHSPTGNLYRVCPPGDVDCILRGIGIFNTVAFSPSGTRFYTADTATGELMAYAYDPDTGTLGDRDPAFAPPSDLPGAPDGSAVDSDGFLWNARWGGSCVVRLAPDGRLDRTLSLPVSQPTSCAFAGTRLMITSAAVGLDETARKAEPWAGGLLSAETGITGVIRPPLSNRFAAKPSD